MFDPSPAELAERDQRRKNYEVLGELAHDLFVGFMAAGFDPDQSLDLTLHALEHGYSK